MEHEKIPVENAENPREMMMRGVAWAKERPALLASVAGGLIAASFVTWLVLRNREPERWHRRMLMRLRELT